MAAAGIDLLDDDGKLQLPPCLGQNQELLRFVFSQASINSSYTVKGGVVRHFVLWSHKE